MTGRLRRIVLLALLPLAGGCTEDERLLLPDRTTESALFRRYVALGNSITAGFMSSGINDSTQRLAYPVLLANRARVSFGVPSLAMPGCPPPLVGVLDTLPDGTFALETDRVGGGTASTCNLRQLPAPERVQNFAVPGARIADAILPSGEGPSDNILSTLILGGRSQVEAMIAAEPTLVSAWLGNNDALGGALSGDLSRMTPLAEFQESASELARHIRIANPAEAVLIGVVDPMIAPVLQPGLYYWALDQLGLSPKPVDDSCAPRDPDGFTNARSMNLVSFLIYEDEQVPAISCEDSAPYLLNAAERTEVDARVSAFNQALSSEANQHGWIYVNPNSVLDNALTGAVAANRLRGCRGLDNGDSVDEIIATVMQQCPWPDAPNFWGSFLTFDGVHPSGELHRIVANAVASAINSANDLTL